MKRLYQWFALLLFALTIAACGDSASTPEGAVKSFFTSIENNDVDKMLSLIDLGEEISDEEMAMIKPKFEMILGEANAEFQAQGGMKNLTIKGTTYNEDKSEAHVAIEFKGDDGKIEADTIPLIKVDKQWKLQSF